MTCGYPGRGCLLIDLSLCIVKIPRGGAAGPDPGSGEARNSIGGKISEGMKQDNQGDGN